MCNPTLFILTMHNLRLILKICTRYASYYVLWKITVIAVTRVVCYL